LARRGVISNDAAAAAERFRSDFQTAALQALRAAQMRERTGTTLLPRGSDECEHDDDRDLYRRMPPASDMTALLDTR